MSATKSRQQLLNFPALLFMSAAIILALVQLFPRQPAFRDPANLSAKDHLSIAYMRVLVRSDPDNSALRLSFVRVLTDAGFDDEAKAALQPLLERSSPKWAFETGLALVRLDLQSLFREKDETATTQAIKSEIVSAFHRLLPLSSTADEQDALMLLAKSFGDPAVLADLHLRMATDPRFGGARRAQLYAQASTYYVAAGQVLYAANAASQAFHWRSDAALRQSDAIAALRAYLAASTLAPGLTLAKESIQQYPNNAELLTLGADIAQSANDESTALQWLLELKKNVTPTLALQERIMRLQLATDLLSDAYETAREMENVAGLTLAQRELLARVFDWNNDLHRSVVQWVAVALAEPNEARERRAFDVALALNSDHDIVALVEQAMTRRAIIASESSAYLASGLRLHEPQRLKQKFETYLRLRRNDRVAWQTLARLNELSGDISASVTAMQASQKLASLSSGEKIALAQNYWRNQQAEAALTLLLSMSNVPEAQTLLYWRLLADIAWYVERDTLARSAYQQILAKYAPDDERAIARLLSLAERAGDKQEMERLADYGWKRRHEKVYLVSLLQLAHQQADDARLAALISEAEQSASRHHFSINDVPEYWQYKAELLQQQGERVAAENALTRLHQLSLHDATVVEAYSWLKLAKIPLDRTSIFGLVEREQFLAAENSSVNDVMAAMQLSLGQAAKALPLFHRSMAQRHHDFFWVMTVADNLEWVGCAHSANQLRVLALGNLAATLSPHSPTQSPMRLADKFHGRLDATFPDDDDDYRAWQRVAMLWELSADALDNANQFALRWLAPRLELDEWQNFAEDFIDHDVEAVHETVWRVAQQVKQFPLEPGAELPLSLNEVAAGGRRRADPAQNQLRGVDSDSCVSSVQFLQQYSDSLPVPRSVTESKTK